MSRVQSSLGAPMAEQHGIRRTTLYDTARRPLTPTMQPQVDDAAPSQERREQSPLQAAPCWNCETAAVEELKES